MPTGLVTLVVCNRSLRLAAGKVNSEKQLLLPVWVSVHLIHMPMHRAQAATVQVEVMVVIHLMLLLMGCRSMG